jgi:uncharacterized repeat protein (TIGR01451 family)
MSPGRSLLLACLLAALAVGASGARPTATLGAEGLSLKLKAGTTKAQVGDVVVYTARVKNTGTETITGLVVSISYPDALNASAMDCPSGPADQVVTCFLGDLAPGSEAVIVYSAEAGSDFPVINGPVTVTASGATGEVATATVKPLRIQAAA